MTGYEFHPDAASDLERIWDYIAESNPDAADTVVADVFAALDSLVSFPYQGHWRTDLASRALRFWRVRNLLIAYAPDQQPLWVIAVIHGSRNPRVIAAILRTRT